jgi:hypothetical protein
MSANIICIFRLFNYPQLSTDNSPDYVHLRTRLSKQNHLVTPHAVYRQHLLSQLSATSSCNRCCLHRARPYATGHSCKLQQHTLLSISILSCILPGKIYYYYHKLFIRFAFYINRWLHSYDFHTRFKQDSHPRIHTGEAFIQISEFVLVRVA